jgi:DnaJ-class molecular chaperone
MKHVRTCYHILNVSPRATDEEVRRAYHALARRYHPDRNPGQKKAQQAFIRVNRAYSMVRTKPQRDAYNRYLLKKMRGKTTHRPLGRLGRFMMTMKEIFWPFTLKREEAPHG